MILPDVNVLVYALRAGTPRHEDFRAWLESVVSGPGSFALSELVLSAVVRILTHPGIFVSPNSVSDVLARLDQLRGRANCVLISPGPRHWEIFTGLCTSAGAKGNLIPDAYLAALAIESGSEWITTDRDFARFPGLKWRHPLVT
ncbi:MAG: type II toxin-antitoxin system VapC family toxin [Acidimicrobiia bacterium]